MHVDLIEQYCRKHSPELRGWRGDGDGDGDGSELTKRSFRLPRPRPVHFC